MRDNSAVLSNLDRDRQKKYNRIWIEPEEIRNERIRNLYSGAAEGIIVLQKKVGLYAGWNTEILSAHRNEVCDILKKTPSKQTMLGYVNAIGLDMNDFHSCYGAEKIKNAIRFAKDLKDRFTVLWLSWILGVTEW